MVMYGAVLPSYKSGKTDKSGKSGKSGTKGKADDNERIKADDPRNRDKVRQILFEE